MWIALRSQRNSSMALKIYKKKESQKEREIKTYLINRKRILISETKETFASFLISYTNTASVPNSINDIALHIMFFNNDGTIGESIISPEKKILMGNSENETDILQAPINIQPRSTVKGWMSFKLPNYLKENKRIDRYEVAATTSDNRRFITCSYLLLDAYE